MQVGTPREIYERPATSFVGSLPRHAAHEPPRRRASTATRSVAGPFRVPVPRGPLPARLEVGVRPEHVRSRVPRASRAEVVAVEPLGAETHLVVRVGDLELRAHARGSEAPRRGDAVRVAIDAARAIVFDADGEGERVP